MILDSFKLDGKVALVTGASAGLGASMAARWLWMAAGWDGRNNPQITQRGLGRNEVLAPAEPNVL